MRINRFLSRSGLGSRRSVESLIKKGKVLVNGAVANKLGIQVDEKRDTVMVDGQVVLYPSRFVYFLLNKPVGVVSSTKRQADEKIVTDFVDFEGLFPVGRLDKASCGLILMTNDGELAHALTHPRKHVAKTYLVTIKGSISPTIINHLSTGVDIGDYMTKPCEVTLKTTTKASSTLEFRLHEGKNRQIRRMCGVFDLEILELKRIAIGPLRLGSLNDGDVKELDEKTVLALRDMYAL